MQTESLVNLYRRADVRDELQILHRRVKARWAKHKRDEGEPQRDNLLFQLAHLEAACFVCAAFRGQLDGITEAIRLFGGRKQSDDRHTAPSESA
jgi:hypothetical protein